MSSCTQLTLLSCSSGSLSFNQLSSGRQSILSLNTKDNNGKRSVNNNNGIRRQNPLSIQQYRPFQISIKPNPNKLNQLNSSSSIISSSSKETTADSQSTDPTMSHNRLKQLKQVYSSNLYLFQCLAFIGFVLLTTRLYEVNKDINYLRHVSNTWLPNITSSSSSSSLSTQNADSIKLSTVSMLTDKNDKMPFASSLTSSFTPSLRSSTTSIDDEANDDDGDADDDGESRFRERSDDFSDSLSDNSDNNSTTLNVNLSENKSKNNVSNESLPKPQALQRTVTRAPFSRFTPAARSQSTGSSSTSNSPASSASSLGNSQSSTINTTPLTTQIDSIQREIDIAKAKSALFHIENLRKDLDSLIGKNDFN